MADVVEVAEAVEPKSCGCVSCCEPGKYFADYKVLFPDPKAHPLEVFGNNGELLLFIDSRNRLHIGPTVTVEKAAAGFVECVNRMMGIPADKLESPESRGMNYVAAHAALYRSAGQSE